MYPNLSLRSVITNESSRDFSKIGHGETGIKYVDFYRFLTTEMMEKITHYINIPIGIDYEEVLKADVIEGFKMALGVNTKEAVIEAYAQMLVNEVEADLVKKRFNHLCILEPTLSAIEKEVESSNLEEYMTELSEVVEEESKDDWHQEPEVFEQPKMVEPEPESVENYTQEELSTIGTSRYFDLDGLVDRIDDLFLEIRSFQGKVVCVAVPDEIFLSYGDMLKSKLGVDIIPFKDADFTTFEDDDFVVAYEHIDGAKGYKTKK